MARSSRIYIANNKITGRVEFANTVKYEFKRRLKSCKYKNELNLWTIGDDKIEPAVEVGLAFFEVEK